MSNFKTNSTFRRLGVADVPELIELFYAVYGDTYSYKLLYTQDHLRQSLLAEKIISFGVFNEAGELVGHTALITKDPANDYVESGMTMRHPKRKPAARKVEQVLFEHLLAIASKRAAFIHQNTTTYHPFAQRNSRYYMNTIYCGFIYSYASGEKIRGIEHTHTEMSSIVYSTPLNSLEVEQKINYLPDNEWGRYFAKIMAAIGGRMGVKFVAPIEKRQVTFPCTLVERNDALGLVRYALCDEGYASVNLESSQSARNFLLHVPAREEFMRNYFMPLIEMSLFPVALRPHNNRDDEIIFQRMELDESLTALQELKLYWVEEQLFLQQWCELAQQHLSLRQAGNLIRQQVALQNCEEFFEL